MGMVIDLGLGRFARQPAEVVSILEQLVRGGYTTLVRELFVLNNDWATARVVEVSKAGTRWLEGGELAVIVSSVCATHDHAGLSDSYSWAELEEVGAHNVQDLALWLDGPTTPPKLTRVRLAPDLNLRLIDLNDSFGNWPPDSIAFALHELALEHRFIVHSA